MTDINPIALYDYIDRTLYASIEQAVEEHGWDVNQAINIAAVVVFVTGVQTAIDRPELAQAILDKWDAQITPVVKAGLDEMQEGITANPSTGLQ